MSGSVSDDMSACQLTTANTDKEPQMRTLGISIEVFSDYEIKMRKKGAIRKIRKSSKNFIDRVRKA